MTKPIRAALVGAGYIASWHAEAIQSSNGARVAAVCDPAMTSATALAERYGATAYASLDAMLRDAACDVAHILTPPHLHRDVAIACLESGLHVLCEKPFALTREDARAMVDTAARTGRRIAVNHNFLGVPSYVRLKNLVRAGDLGSIDAADIHWRHPLAPLRSGPFGSWMLRQPENLLLEIGPHPFAFAIDLFGPLTDISLKVGKPIDVPGCGTTYQSWRILARAGAVDVTISISLVEGVDDRSVSLRGVSGSARLDFANDTLTVDRPNAAGLIANPLVHELSIGTQHLREGLANAARQARTLNRQSAYALGFQAAVKAFYQAVETGRPMDDRFSGTSGALCIEAIRDTLDRLPATATAEAAPASDVEPAGLPILVIGGTGFIGRALTYALVATGRKVRILSRGRSNPFADLGTRVDIISGDLGDPATLKQAMQGVDAVYHLAKADEATLARYMANDVRVTDLIADTALAAGVRRFIYTGTIASYDASDPQRPINENTEFGCMERRNPYARAKAICEANLLEKHRTQGLPLVIARPGIVVGPGGPLQHWGIGRWHGSGAVRVWGGGKHPLPFVLVDDVADGLVKMLDTPGIEGQSFNLVGAPLLSAQDYFDGIHRHARTRIRVKPGSLFGLYLADALKYHIKRHVLRRRDIMPVSLADWQSRAHLSPFHNDSAREKLDWQPESDKERFLERAIVPERLFGF